MFVQISYSVLITPVFNLNSDQRLLLLTFIYLLQESLFFSSQSLIGINMAMYRCTNTKYQNNPANEFGYFAVNQHYFL